MATRDQNSHPDPAKALKPAAAELRKTRLLTRPDHSQAMAIPHAELQLLSDTQGAQNFAIDAGGLLLGSDADCQLVLDDSSVSRRHCEIKPGPDGFVVRDLHSRNGTWINGLRVDRATLSGGEQLRIGETRLLFKLLDGETEYPLSRKSSFGQLYGRSVAMRSSFVMLERAAQSDATLLIQGESGTGKDLAAQSVHEASPRHAGPFVVVDCGAMQANLVESELFGHARGAFTGALQAREGAFERADGGTLFLDEIGDLDLALQPMLLRALERRETKRLGENHYRSADVRVIAATHQDLRSAVQKKTFRQDLYYRLSVLQTRMPPLRDRPDDIGLLAHRMVQKLRPQDDPEKLIPDSLIAILAQHDWPGNVRELRNIVERILLFPEQPMRALQDSDLELNNDPAAADQKLDFRQARQQCIERFEKQYVLRALDDNEGSASKAAAASGVPRQSFYRLLSRYGIRR